MPRRRRIVGGGNDRPLYMISVAADLAGVHPQTLRIYERKQLVSPSRSQGNTRLYSDADIDRLRLIQQLTQEEGINLAGVVRIIELTDEQAHLEAELEQLRALVQVMRRRIAENEVRARSVVRTDLVLIPRGGLQRRHG
ncbi:MAG: helix-turn-helix transcriptional regulator [Coriobacteriia bacterium]|nr:helix-turn-helix transcriptional regulator [Coriobacteriia bacterium]